MKTSLLPTPEDLTLPQIMKRFSTEKTAVAYLESIRWADGIVCPHCGNNDQNKFWVIKASKSKKVRVGLRQCACCKKQFRVTVGTVFEDSHIPLNLWLVAWYLLCGAKKGMSALQLQRHLGLGSYRSAWFMAHRIRHAMQDPIFSEPLKGTVEADETYVGGKTRGKGPAYRGNKTAVFSLVERNGNKRSMVMERVTSKNIRTAVEAHVEMGSKLMTDESNCYKWARPDYNRQFTSHGRKEYARGDVHSNTVESSFSLLKRGVVGSFHHVTRKYLPLYLAEFDFRWNQRKVTDGERTVAGLRKTEGKRLTLKTPKNNKKAA
jgi:transposase-like protein